MKLDIIITLSEENMETLTTIIEETVRKEVRRQLKKEVN